MYKVELWQEKNPNKQQQHYTHEIINTSSVLKSFSRKRLRYGVGGALRPFPQDQS